MSGLVTVGLAITGTQTQGSTEHSAVGFGTFASPGGGNPQSPPTHNNFSFTASTATNGSGGSGFITVFDSGEQNYYDAQVTCLYVSPTTGNAIIWGRIIGQNVGYANWQSVVLNVHPGSGSAAGFGNYLETYGASSTCGPRSSPGTPPIQAGLITTS